MSEIPFYFDTPVPSYFRESGLFDNENTFKFVTWAFSRCSTESRKVFLKKPQLELILEPFEFIAGRLTSPKECFLTEKQFRGQLISMQKAGFLKKGANSRANTFSTYIWVTERFSKTQGQPKGQRRANRGPTEGHNNIEEENIRFIESHHPYPSSFQPSQNRDGDRTRQTEDFSSKIKKEPSKIEIIPGISLSQKQFDACMAYKNGSLEDLKKHIDFIWNSPERKYPISNWLKALQTWEFKEEIKPRVKENEEMAKRLEEYFGSAPGWRCEIHTDRMKDQRGILFYPTTSTGMQKNIFHSFADPNFKENVSKTLRDKKLQIPK